MREAQSLHAEAELAQQWTLSQEELRRAQLVSAMRQLSAAQGRVKERAQARAALHALQRSLKEVDDVVLSRARQRWSAIAREQASIAAAVARVGESERAVLPALSGQLVGVSEAVGAIRRQHESDLQARAKELQQMEAKTEKELRALYGGHLPKLVAIDEGQTQEPGWGGTEGWGEVEVAIRHVVRIARPGVNGGGIPLSPTASSSSLVLSDLSSKPELELRRVRVKRQPFGVGGMRIAYLCEDVTDCVGSDYSDAIRLVAKESRWAGLYKGQLENAHSVYLHDMRAQLLGQELVERFNAAHPPKLAQMLIPLLYEFPNRVRTQPDRRYMHVELSLLEHGEFKKSPLHLHTCTASCCSAVYSLSPLPCSPCCVRCSGIATTSTG